MNSKRLLLFLLAAVIGIWCPSSYGMAGSTEITFPLSHNPEEKTVIVLKGKSVLIRDFPDAEMFNYVMLKLGGVEGELPMKKSRNVRGQTYDVKFDLWDVPKGTYFIEMYAAPEKYTAYASYNHSQPIYIEVSDTSVEFVLPLALEKNKEIFNAILQDADTLAHYLKPSPKILSDHPVVIELAETITAGSVTDYEKAKSVHDWVSENIWYDYDELYSGIPREESVLETLASKKGVCIDFASLTAALLRAINIPAKLQAGYVLSTSAQECWTEELLCGSKCNHAWNEAYADGRWIIIDTTYDSGNSYKNKTFSAGTGIKYRKYFDITIEFLSTDRRIVENEFDPVGNR